MESENLVCIRNSKPLVLFDFEGNFLCQKSTEKLDKIKKGGQHVLLTHFHNFEFKSTLFLKSVSNFGPSNQKEPNTWS